MEPLVPSAVDFSGCLTQVATTSRQYSYNGSFFWRASCLRVRGRKLEDETTGPPPEAQEVFYCGNGLR
ncbi:MAG: hypothetical protein ABW346_07510, partial [Terrimicrobium sp.]